MQVVGGGQGLEKGGYSIDRQLRRSKSKKRSPIFMREEAKDKMQWTRLLWLKSEQHVDQVKNKNVEASGMDKGRQSLMPKDQSLIEFDLTEEELCTVHVRQARWQKTGQ